jgi:hypothetical protein
LSGIIILFFSVLISGTFTVSNKMSSSPDDKKPAVTGSLGRGRGRVGRYRSPSPRVVAGFVRPSDSPHDGSGSGSDETVAGLSIARPGSNSPPQTAAELELTAGLGKIALAENPNLTAEEADAAAKEPRGAKRGNRPDDDYAVVTRPKHLTSKYGLKGNVVNLLTNYFKLKKGPMWKLYGYHVFFEPQEDREFIKKYILKSKKDVIGAYIFDG